MKSDYSELSRLIAKKLNKAFRFYKRESSEERVYKLINNSLKNLEKEHRDMRSLLLKIHSARIAMSEVAIMNALDDIDKFFREDNLN